MRRGGRFLIIDPLDNESVFTYYSEFEPHWQGQTYIEVCVMILIFILAFVSNVLVLLIIFRKKRQVKVTDIFIANLSITDLIFTAAIPLVIVTRLTVHWVLGNATCKLLSYVQFISGAMSILTMMMISIDRYIVICKKNSSSIGKKFNVKVAWICVGICWVLGLSISSPVIIGLTERDFIYQDQRYTFCAILWPELFRGGIFIVSLVTFLFLLPLVVISIMYLNIFLFVRNTSKKLQPIQQNTKVQMKLVKMFVTVLGLFVVMWLPFFIILFLIFYTELVTSTHFTASVIMTNFNPCLNPILYGYFNESYREGMKKLFSRDCKRHSLRVDPNTTVLSVVSSTHREFKC